MDNPLRNKKKYTIAEVSQKTGLPLSTIRFYVQEGLIPKPVKTSQTRAYYSSDHIKVLRRIQRKKTVGKKSLKKIKEELDRKSGGIPGPAETQGGIHPQENILSSATELFSRKGYAETTIDDIAEHARVSKETVYKYFRSKEALFMECADKVFHDMYRDVWQQLREEKDIVKRSAKRASAFFASYPKWITMMNLARSLSVGKGPFKEKFKDLLRLIIDPIVKEQKRLKEQGVFPREVDYDLMGYMSMGMAEYGAILISQGMCTEEEVIEYIHQIVINGLLNT